MLEYHCLIQVYDDQLWSSLEQVLLLPLCQRIETDLRLHHHAALLTGVPPMNPHSTDMLDVTPLLEVDTLQLSTRAVDIRWLFLNLTFAGQGCFARWDPQPEVP